MGLTPQQQAYQNKFKFLANRGLQHLDRLLVGVESIEPPLYERIDGEIVPKLSRVTLAEHSNRYPIGNVRQGNGEVKFWIVEISPGLEREITFEKNPRLQGDSKDPQSQIRLAVLPWNAAMDIANAFKDFYNAVSDRAYTINDLRSYAYSLFQKLERPPPFLPKAALARGLDLKPTNVGIASSGEAGADNIPDVTPIAALSDNLKVSSKRPAEETEDQQPKRTRIEEPGNSDTELYQQFFKRAYENECCRSNYRPMLTALEKVLNTFHNTGSPFPSLQADLELLDAVYLRTRHSVDVRDGSILSSNSSPNSKPRPSNSVASKPQPANPANKPTLHLSPTVEVVITRSTSKEDAELAVYEVSEQEQGGRKPKPVTAAEALDRIKAKAHQSIKSSPKTCAKESAPSILAQAPRQTPKPNDPRKHVPKSPLPRKKPPVQTPSTQEPSIDLAPKNSDNIPAVSKQHTSLSGLRAALPPKRSIPSPVQPNSSKSVTSGKATNSNADRAPAIQSTSRIASPLFKDVKVARVTVQDQALSLETQALLRASPSIKKGPSNPSECADETTARKRLLVSLKVPNGWSPAKSSHPQAEQPSNQGARQGSGESDDEIDTDSEDDSDEEIDEEIDEDTEDDGDEDTEAEMNHDDTVMTVAVATPPHFPTPAQIVQRITPQGTHLQGFISWLPLQSNHEEEVAMITLLNRVSKVDRLTQHVFLLNDRRRGVPWNAPPSFNPFDGRPPITD